MTREELDFIGSMNMCDEISNEAYKKIVCHCEEQEPCENAISRKSAIEAFQMFREYQSNRNNKEWVDRIETVLNQLPPVNPQPKTGHWIDVFGGCECSECGCLEGGYSDYCPDCGAKMIEPQESEKLNKKPIETLSKEDLESLTGENGDNWISFANNLTVEREGLKEAILAEKKDLWKESEDKDENM